MIISANLVKKPVTVRLVNVDGAPCSFVIDADLRRRIKFSHKLSLVSLITRIWLAAINDEHSASSFQQNVEIVFVIAHFAPHIMGRAHVAKKHDKHCQDRRLHAAHLLLITDGGNNL